MEARPHRHRSPSPRLGVAILMGSLSPRGMDIKLIHRASTTHQLSSSRVRAEGTDFGQSRFGHPDLTRPILAKANFGQSNFGQSNFLANILGVIKPRKSGSPEGWGPEGWGPKISRSFFPLPPQFFVLFSLSFGLFRGILVVFEAPGPSNVHVWSSRAVVCEPRRPGLVGPPGFHTKAREPKRAHLRVPVF